MEKALEENSEDHTAVRIATLDGTTGFRFTLDRQGNPWMFDLETGSHLDAFNTKQT